jgi:hypothetical protein
VQELVRSRANQLCEYCHTNERWQYVRFTIDHLSPVVESGGDEPDNLALACFHCNRRKSNRQVAIDPVTGHEVALFNPRQQHWAEHFLWSADGLHILALTAVGRATVELLELNRARVLRIRAADVRVDRHPPVADPIQKLS